MVGVLGRRAGRLVPPVGGPCLADQATDRNDRVGEVEEGVNDFLAPFVAALQAVEGVMPGIGAFDGQRWLARIGAFSPLCAIWPVILRAAVSSRVTWESYPASRWTRMSSGSGPRSASLSSTPASSGESWRLAGASTRSSGMPYPSVMSDLFIPLLAAVHRAAASALAATGCLGDAAVDEDLLQDQAGHAVIRLQRDLLEPGEDPGLGPFITAGADRGRLARAVGDRLIQVAEPQDLDQLLEDEPVTDPFAVAASRRGYDDRSTRWPSTTARSCCRPS
jgi:hypothetical protein